eukprot:6202745-Pleurochrysis_carterae.AAC.2
MKRKMTSQIRSKGIYPDPLPPTKAWRPSRANCTSSSRVLGRERPSVSDRIRNKTLDARQLAVGLKVLTSVAEARAG